MKKKKLIEVLKHVEWVCNDGLLEKCPWCGYHRTYGHASSCKLAEALREGGK